MLRGLGELSGLAWRPEAEEIVPVVCGEVPARSLAPGEPFTLLSWNVQFCAGRSRHFFFDGGPDVHVPRTEVEAVLSGVAREAEGAELALLQEVDRGSDRTGRLDQLPSLTRGAACWVSAPYHRSSFVPVPPRRPLGRVEMHLAVASRVRLAGARRYALPPLAEPAWRRAFNLRRALLAVDVPLTDGRTLAVGVTHLSAFSRGDGTLPRQVDVLCRWMDAQQVAGRPFVLAGDFNLLPPVDEPRRLPDPGEYADSPSALLPLLARSCSVVPLDRADDPARWTYQAYGRTPDRTLDYVFVSEGVDVLGWDIRPTDRSDHLPVRARLSVRAR